MKHGTQGTRINDCLVLDWILNAVFHKVQFWVHYSLIIIWLTYIMNAKKLIFQTMLTTKLPLYALLTFPRSFLNYGLKWSGNNHVKANLGKCQLWLSIKSSKVVSIDGVQRISSTAKNLLGITVDSQLNFENNPSAICNKVSRKINALGWIANYMYLEKRHFVMKTFAESKFNYCPRIWLFHLRTISNKINRLYERALRIVYSEFKSSFDALLMKDNFNTWKKHSKFNYRNL